MPKTLQQMKVEDATRVIEKHVPRLAIACACGEVWSPLHVAQELAKTGVLR